MFLTKRYNLNKILLDSVKVDDENAVIKLIKSINDGGCLSYDEIYKYTNVLRSELTACSEVSIRYKVGTKGKDYDFFLDIDETICDHSITLDSEIDHDLILNVLDNNHAIYRGVKELLFFILKIEGSRIIFYSAGKPERNNILVCDLIKIFGLETFSDRILVHSETLLTNPHDEIYCPDFNLIQNGMGNKKKKISNVARDINNSILIDDDRSYCIKGEEFNFVRFAENTNQCSVTDKNINGIFRIAGMIYLFLCQNDFTLVQFMQLILANDAVSNTKLYYDIGLDVLMTFNPHLCLNNPRSESESVITTQVKPVFVPDPPEGMCHALISEKLISTWFPGKETIIIPNDKRYDNGKTLIYNPKRLTDIYYRPGIFQYDKDTCGLKHIMFPEFLIYLEDGYGDLRFKISIHDKDNDHIVRYRYERIRFLLTKENIATNYVCEYYDYRHLREKDIIHYFHDGKVNVSGTANRQLDMILVKLTNNSTVKRDTKIENRFLIHKDNDMNHSLFSYYAKWVSYKDEIGDFIHFTH